MDHTHVLNSVAVAPQGVSRHSPCEPNETVLRFNPRALTLFFVAIEVVLVVVFIVLAALQVLDHDFASLFNIDVEGTISAWFSGTMFFLAAIPAAIRGLQMRQADRRSPYRIYFVGAVGLAFLSMDEVGQVHEKIDARVAVGLYVGVAMASLVILWREAIALLREKAGRRSLIGGVASFLFGAVVMDQFAPNKWWSPERAVEEFSEMFGATLIFYGLASRVRPFKVVVVSGEAAATGSETNGSGTL